MGTPGKLASAADMQALCDELDLIGASIEVGLVHIDVLSPHYTIEAGSHFEPVVTEFDSGRIRIWYDEATRLVTAVVHG